MGAASSRASLCSKCNEYRRTGYQLKGGAPVCRQCYLGYRADEADKLRQENHALRMEIARLKKFAPQEFGEPSELKGYLKSLAQKARENGPPVEKWDGMTL